MYEKWENMNNKSNLYLIINVIIKNVANCDLLWSLFN